jgi:hypothetical protein
VSSVRVRVALLCLSRLHTNTSLTQNLQAPNVTAIRTSQNIKASTKDDEEVEEVEEEEEEK